MAIRSIDDLRAQAGADWADSTDEDLISAYSKSLNLDPAQVANTLGYKAADSGVTANRFGASIDRYQAGLYGLGEAVTGALGFEGAAESLAERRRANELEADVYSARAREQGAIESYKDIGSVGDFGSYAAGLAIQSAPYLAESLVGGIAGRAVMGGTKAALRTAVTAGDEAAAATARQALNRGATMGAVAAGYPSAVSDVLGSQREQAGETDLGSAAALGVPYAALNAFGIEGALARREGFRNTMNLLDDVSGIKGGVARAGVTGARIGAVEGISETAQEALNQYGRMVVDPNEAFLSDAAKDRFAESFVGGATLGGLGGAGAGGWRRSQPGSMLGGVNNSGTETGTETNAINSAIDSNSPEVMGPLPEQFGPPEVVGPRQIPQNQQVQQAVDAAASQQAQEDAAIAAEQQRVQQLNQTRMDAFNKFGGNVIQRAKGNSYELQGNLYHTQQALNIALDKIVAQEQSKPELQRVVEAAYAKAVKATGGKLPTPTSIVKDTQNFFAEAESLEDVLERVEIQLQAELAKVKSPQQLAKVEPLHALRDELAGVPMEQRVPTVDLLPKGKQDERLQLQQQSDAGLRAVPEQGTTTQAVSGQPRRVRPSGVQPVESGSVAQGQDGQQVGAVPGERVRPSTVDSTAGGRTVPDAKKQAPQITFEKDDLLVGTADKRGAVISRLINRLVGRGIAAGKRYSDVKKSIIKTANLNLSGAGFKKLDAFLKANTKKDTEKGKTARLSDEGRVELANTILEERFKKSKNKARDIEIAQAYLKDRTDKSVEAIAKKYNIKPVTVRKIGNFEAIMETADALDINRDDVERLFGVRGAEAFADTTESAEDLEKEVTALEEGATEDTTPVLSDEEAFGNEEKGQKAGFATLSEGSKGTANVFDFEKASYKDRVEKLKEGKLEKDALSALYEQAMDKNDQPTMDAITERLTALAKETAKKVKRRNVKKEMEAEAAAEEGGTAKTPVEKAEALWNKYAEQHGLGLYEDQTSVVQGYVVDLVYDKKDNLAGLNNLIAENDLVAATEKTQFSRNEGAGKTQTWDATDLKTLLKQMFEANRRFDELITVVDSYEDLPKYVQAAVKKSDDIQAFVYGKRVYMIASQIQYGQELPVFLHEVGVHLGMQNLIGTLNYRKLTAQIMDWSKSKTDTVESIVARSAKARVDAAVKTAKDEGTPLTADEQLDELLAYFVEEAVALGIKPEAMKDQKGALASWFRTLMAAMKVALRKIGFGKFDQLSAGNIVDLSFGAAKLEISGTYHGSAAEFRNFRTAKIGTGEGAVAYGWGLYMAERFGIAKDYMKADVRRKYADDFGLLVDNKVMFRGIDSGALVNYDMQLYTKDYARYMENSVANSVAYKLKFGNTSVAKAIKDTKSSNERLLAEVTEKLNKKGLFTKKLSEADRKGLERDKKFYEDSVAAIARLQESDFVVEETGKKGAVYRTLPMVSEDKVLDLDARLSKQPEVLKLLESKMSEELKTDLVEETNLELSDMTGRDLQEGLAFLENKGISDLFFQLPDSVIDTIKQGRFMSKQVVSEYLRMLGIEGNTYLDRSSRGLSGSIAVAKIPGLKNVDFSGIIDFKPAYVTIKGSRLSVVSTDKQNVPLDMVIPSGSDQYMEILENVLDERDRETRNTVLFSDQALSRVASFERGKLDGQVKFSRRTSGNIQKLPKQLQGPVAEITATIADFARRGVTYLAFTEDLASIASKYIKSAKEYVSLVREQQAVKTKYERRVDLILQQYDKLPASLRGTGEGSVNMLLKDSTMSGKWAFQPDYMLKKVEIDPALEARFNAMPAAQAVIKAVFKHGYDTLQDMKKGVMENITSEYDALIKAARDSNDIQELALLQKKKAQQLKDYTSLMAVQAGKPYAPLKRFGNFVVVAKSKDYLEQEAIIKNDKATEDEKKDARAKLRELEKSEKHYFVSFAETKREGRKIEEELLTEGYGYVSEAFEKDSTKTDVYGGRDVQNVFYRLRNLANDSLDENTGDKSSKAINRLINDLHLTLLAEQSARQSERRRKGIAGAEDDMMRSFATQGMATAHFIATLHNSGKIYDSLQSMQREADAQTPGRDVRREYYNEFMKRHALGLDYEPNTILNKTLSTTSFYMLLTNPAYYLQNMTQPFMLSLPSVAGKHGYDKSWAEFSKAYKEIFQLINKEGLSEESYAKLPADVRDAIETLVNSGRIDISLDQDLGRWRDSEGSKTELAGKAIEKLRKVAQDIESVNRVATAVAAYRLEKASGSDTDTSIAYANQIILDTHGDYSGFNAPRITRKGMGRLATQFRKFQLIQISLMAKLIKQSFAGASKEEKMIARRALGFTLAHTLAAGGVMGFPGFAAIAWVMGAAFGDDDEPDNPELTLRKMIGNKELADVILKGAPKFFGVDLSGKLGMGQMLSILPYTDVDLSKAGIAQAGYALMTGPAGSLVQRAGEGLNLMADGEYYKGTEKFMPGVVAQSMKAARFGLMDGITLKNGDVVMSPEDISFLDMLSVAIGLPSNKITDRQFVQGVAIETDRFYKDRTGEIKRDYVKAVNAKDTASMAKARQEWVELQNVKDKQKLKRQPLSDLLKAPQEQKKREGSVEAGVPVSKSNKQYIKEVSKI
jgi:hypothetical protein